MSIKQGKKKKEREKYNPASIVQIKKIIKNIFKEYLIIKTECNLFNSCSKIG